MLGDNLCIVPVMNEEGIAEFYVPDCGTWTDIQSGETYEGGKYYTRDSVTTSRHLSLPVQTALSHMVTLMQKTR